MECLLQTDIDIKLINFCDSVHVNLIINTISNFNFPDVFQQEVKVLDGSKQLSYHYMQE